MILDDVKGKKHGLKKMYQQVNGCTSGPHREPVYWGQG